MVLPPKNTHPKDEPPFSEQKAINQPLEIDTYDGKLHVEWDPNASVTPIGQLPFFIQFLKLGNRFGPWVDDCPLDYQSNNAPKKINVLGSLMLSILSGHTRYSHLTSLLCDRVNSRLLGMSKMVSPDSALRGLRKIEEVKGIDWMRKHLYSSYSPLLQIPWILDVDVTVKPIYGHQQGAKIGYNPHKPGRPSHAYHTYMMANLRLVLEVEIQPGNQTHSNHSLPGLIRILDSLAPQQRPQFSRGDCDWGTDNVMSQMEQKGYDYLFKVKKSKYVKQLIEKHHILGEWTKFNYDWEGKDAQLQLQGWKSSRRVVIVRRRLAHKNALLGVEFGQPEQQSLAFVEEAEDIKLYEYSVLVTSLDDEVVSIIQHYRDRADCENVFDEIKNQWGWGGYTTHDLKRCQFISRMIALVYNWWNLFVRMINPGHHYEAITSRPLLLSSIGRLTESGRQKRLVISSSHGKIRKFQERYQQLNQFFIDLKQNAEQLTSQEIWWRILEKAMEAFSIKLTPDPPNDLPALI